MSGDEGEEKKRQISEWLDVYANSSDPSVCAAEDQLPVLRALEKRNCSPIALLEQYPFLSVAVVSLEGTTLKPFITIVHHVVEYRVADNKDDEDSDGVESCFQGVITLGDAEDLGNSLHD